MMFLSERGTPVPLSLFLGGSEVAWAAIPNRDAGPLGPTAVDENAEVCYSFNIELDDGGQQPASIAWPVQTV